MNCSISFYSLEAYKIGTCIARSWNRFVFFLSLFFLWWGKKVVCLHSFTTKSHANFQRLVARPLHQNKGCCLNLKWKFPLSLEHWLSQLHIWNLILQLVGLQLCKGGVYSAGPDSTSLVRICDLSIHIQ